jgi:hypothetical protein
MSRLSLASFGRGTQGFYYYYHLQTSLKYTKIIIKITVPGYLCHISVCVEKWRIKELKKKRIRSTPTNYFFTSATF